MKSNHDFWSVILGKGAPGLLAGYVVVGYICAAAMVFILISTRDKESPRTPRDFSMKFFLADTWAQIAASILLIPIAIRCVYEYVPPVGMFLLSVGIGFGFQGLAAVAKEIGILTTQKLSAKVAEKLKAKENQNPQ